MKEILPLRVAVRVGDISLNHNHSTMPSGDNKPRQEKPAQENDKAFVGNEEKQLGPASQMQIPTSKIKVRIVTLPEP